jgi:hypothetical protein
LGLIQVPSEIHESARIIEEIEREAAKKRQAEAGKNFGRGIAPVNFTEAMKEKEPGYTRDKVGEAFGISGVTLQRIHKVCEEGAPELIQAMDKGEIAVHTAAEIVNLSKPQQAEVIAKGKDAALPVKREHECRLRPSKIG